MLDIGWTEMMVIGVVALVVIGPKDLPDMFRTMGRFTGKMRGMARDFQRAMDQAAKDSGVSDVAADLKTATSAKNMGLNGIKDAVGKFEKWDPMKAAIKPAASAAPVVAMGPAMAAPSAPVAAEPSILGPATQALADKQAARKAIVKDAAEKLKAASAEPIAASATPARKPRAKAVDKEVAAVATKPRAARKTTKAGDA